MDKIKTRYFSSLPPGHAAAGLNLDNLKTSASPPFVHSLPRHQVLREYKFRYRPLPLFCADPDLPGLPVLLAYVGRRVVERVVERCAQMEYYVRDAQLGLSELRYFVSFVAACPCMSLPPQL